MKNSWLLSAILAAGPVTAVSLTPLAVLASPANSQSSLFVSDVKTISNLLGSRQVRVGIRILPGANVKGDGDCTSKLTPDIVTIELLDSETLAVLKVSSRYYSSESSGQIELKDSMTTSCRDARYQVKRTENSDELQLVFHWDVNSPFAITGVGPVDIPNNAIFKRAR